MSSLTALVLFDSTFEAPGLSIGISSDYIVVVIVVTIPSDGPSDLFKGSDLNYKAVSIWITKAKMDIICQTIAEE
jgi:hypothetical protein